MQGFPILQQTMRSLPPIIFTAVLSTLPAPAAKVYYVNQPEGTPGVGAPGV
jgi:hypothetical protein